jgi:hypothetical protein
MPRCALRFSDEPTGTGAGIIQPAQGRAPREEIQ